MIKRYMHKRERYFAMLNDNRIVRPFDWGTEFITDHPNGDDPRKLFAEYSREMVANSAEFFFSPEISDFDLEGNQLIWTSGIKTPSIENNTSYATYFPHETNKKSAVLVLPHWNAKAGTYFDLCKFFNKVGISALRLTLP
ncbi:MAG: hypothetical protein H7070_04630, partial [Saprospiraceae bacterium]|nr:hypothetical protein [Pyrinomonadaceae bacterium]